MSPSLPGLACRPHGSARQARKRGFGVVGSDSSASPVRQSISRFAGATRLSRLSTLNPKKKARHSGKRHWYRLPSMRLMPSGVARAESQEKASIGRARAAGRPGFRLCHARERSLLSGPAFEPIPAGGARDWPGLGKHGTNWAGDRASASAVALARIGGPPDRVVPLILENLPQSNARPPDSMLSPSASHQMLMDDQNIIRNLRAL